VTSVSPVPALKFKQKLATHYGRRIKPDVCFWPKADMPKNAINVAIGGKADISLCAAYVC